MPKKNHSLRIHGDNILECESALRLIASSINGGDFNLIGGSAYSPIYTFNSRTGEYFTAQLFPGYGRWNFPLVEHIASLGGTLREAPDAVITRVEVERASALSTPAFTCKPFTYKSPALTIGMFGVVILNSS